ncbi:hypothetical protein AB6G21_11300 [Providencia hangzhouensis]|uniref:hypothetical protein n=1 Tax=Providencia hangzhouensis TaxID=3031799 RepID=UPI0034DD38BF
MKIITIPLSKEAMYRLGSNESVDGDLLKLDLNDNQLYLLNKVNLFELINSNLA